MAFNKKQRTCLSYHLSILLLFFVCSHLNMGWHVFYNKMKSIKCHTCVVSLLVLNMNIYAIHVGCFFLKCTEYLRWQKYIFDVVIHFKKDLDSEYNCPTKIKVIKPVFPMSENYCGRWHLALLSWLVHASRIIRVVLRNNLSCMVDTIYASSLYPLPPSTFFTLK